MAEKKENPQIRQWATNVLSTFIRQGYVLDKNRLINGQMLDQDYFDHFVFELQEIRASERKFCQKITDLYATAVDYSVDSQITREFFAAVLNHLSKDKIREWNEIVAMYLDYATRQARRHIPMTMADWASKLGVFLQFNDGEILQNKGKVTAAIAESFAESEFERYRILQDDLYQSDFDRLIADTLQEE